MVAITLNAVSVVAAGDVDEPNLSSPSASALSATTASGSITTDEDNGTLYYLASENASEDAATVKAAGSQAVSATGAQAVSFTGLTPGTIYYAHYVHRDTAGNDSTVSTSAAITTHFRLTLSGVSVAGVAPVIASATGNAAGGTVTITIESGFDLTAAEAVAVTLSGTVCTNIVATGALTCTATLPADGFALGSNQNLVIAVDGASSSPLAHAFNPALGAFVTLTQPYATLHPDSPLKNPAYSALVAGDQVEYDPTSNPTALTVSIAGDGLVTITGADGEDDQYVDFALIDASDSYARSNVSTWTFSESGVDQAPTVTPPANLNIEYANGGSGLDKSNSNLIAWLASATAADPEEGAITASGDVSALADPIPPGTHVITFTATDTGGNEGTATASLIVAEAALPPPNTARYTSGMQTARIASGRVDQYVYFTAVDETDLTTSETGLTNFTVTRTRNGGAPVAMDTPTVTEVDPVEMPGVYSLLVDEDTTIDGGSENEEMVLSIKASGMAGTLKFIELYNPKVTVEANEDKGGYAISGTKNTLDDLVDVTIEAIAAEIVSAIFARSHAESVEPPAANANLADKINWMFALSKNDLIQNANTLALRDDSGNNDIAVAPISDVSGVTRRGKFV